MGQISLSFYAVTGGVVQEVLERLGHNVEVTTGSHGQIFPRLGAGEVDLLVAAWLPHGHAVYWKQYGDRAEQIAVLYEGARFDWMVPTYVPESLVASVEDLAKPDVVARMEHRIQGTGRDSGNMMVSADVVKAYGLDAAGYELVPGTLAQFHGYYDQAIAQGKWFVMPLWTPALHQPRGQYAHHRRAARVAGPGQRWHAGRKQGLDDAGARPHPGGTGPHAAGA